MRFRFAALILGLSAAMVGAELTLRIIGLGFGSSPMESDPFLHHVHPKSYTFVEQHPSGEVGGFTVRYDESGRVVSSQPSAAPPRPDSATCRVALMGDSFVEAGQVPFEQSFAGLLEAAAGQTCTVRNYGVRSYSPAIYLVQWTRDIQPWHPTHVLVLLFSNDLREDVAYMTTAVTGRDGWPEAIQGPGGGWLFAQLRRSYVARFVRTVGLRASWAWAHRGQDQMTIDDIVEENPDWVEPTPGLVGELKHRVEAGGARFVLMAVPSRYRLMGDGRHSVGRDFHESVRQWAETHGVGFLNLDEPFERAARSGFTLFFRRDIHFTPDGHAVTAGAIARLFPDLFGGGRTMTGGAVRAAFPDGSR